MPNQEDWPMRIAKSDIPEREIPLFLRVVEGKGYAWWGASHNASQCEELLIMKMGYTKIAYGKLSTIDCKDRDDIDDEDFHSHRPDGEIYHNKEKFHRYYKINGGAKEFIERHRIHDKYGDPIKYNTRANVRVSVE